MYQTDYIHHDTPWRFTLSTGYVQVERLTAPTSHALVMTPDEARTMVEGLVPLLDDTALARLTVLLTAIDDERHPRWRHAEAVEASLDATERRYPEVNHPDGCGCWGCSEGSY